MAYGDEFNRPVAHAWILLCFGLALHVFDEATTGFLKISSPTVLALRDRLGWWPMPTFEFGTWLSRLIVAVVLLLSLTWLVARGALGTRALAYFLAVLGSPVVRCRRAYAGHDLQPDGREGDVSTAGARVLVVAACGSVGNLLISAASPLGATQAE